MKQDYAVLLIGKDGSDEVHIGNKRFWTIVKRHAKTYRNVSLREERVCISNDIVAMIRSHGGRFFKRNQTTGFWEAQSDAAAQAEVAGALRSLKALKRRRQQLKRRRVVPNCEPSKDEDALFERALMHQRQRFAALVNETKDGTNAPPSQQSPSEEEGLDSTTELASNMSNLMLNVLQ